MKELVKLSVPATTANLGPGFDCLGMSLDIWNQFELSPSESPALRVKGEGEGSLSTGPGNLVYRAAERYFREIGLSVPSLPRTLPPDSEPESQRKHCLSSSARFHPRAGAGDFCRFVDWLKRRDCR